MGAAPLDRSDLPRLGDSRSLERYSNFGEASDVLRYEILSRHGGVYVDTDVECLRSLEPLVDDASAFAAYARPGLIGSAVVGAVPGHPAIARALEVVRERAGSGSQVEATGPVALTAVLKDAPDVQLFGRETFYPLDYWEIPFADAGGDVVANAYAIHHWHATWQSRETLMLRTRELMRRTRKLKAQNERVRARLEKRLARRTKDLRWRSNARRAQAAPRADRRQSLVATRRGLESGGTAGPPSPGSRTWSTLLGSADYEARVPGARSALYLLHLAPRRRGLFFVWSRRRGG